MKKLAIVTLYDDVNIGNKLQNYALERVLADKGFSVSSVVCKESQYHIRRLPFKRQVKIMLLSRLRRQQRLFAQRTRRFGKFSEAYLSPAETVSFSDPVQSVLQHYDAFVVGSDQVWHNWRNNKHEVNYYLLRFAPEHKRICYAPSFGFDQVPEKYRKIYTDGLQGFPQLCCRERSGCEMIRELTGREAELVCDPTLLLSASDWDRIAAKPEYAVPEKFMLVYFLGGKSPYVAGQIQRIAKEKGLAVIDVYSSDLPEYYMTAPDEFLYLMGRASYVCTDSFHGSVFASLYHRPFHVFSRGDTGGAKMGNRIATLLEQLGICMETVPGEGTDTFWNENFSRSDSSIIELRNKAHAYLSRVLPE